MHIGSFTKQGTWRAASEQFPELARIGITVIEMMPVAEFPGKFGWGYDGVNLFAPSHLYGTPDDLRAFIDRAHSLGLAVILDVVYNHFGPDGNYLGVFSDNYLVREKGNEWGDAINFDGPNSGPVREFFITNGRYWIEEFQFDGFRFDATHAIRDQADEYIIGAVGHAAREAAGSRSILLIAENDLQEAKMARPLNEGGDDLDGMWNDDVHHSAVVAWTGSLLRRLPRRAAGIYFRGQIWIPLSGPGALMAKSVARNLDPRDCSGGFCLLHREPRPNREHRTRPAIALANFTGTLPRHGRSPFAWSLDAAAVSGRRIRRLQPVSIFRGRRRCFRARSDSERSRSMAGAVFIAERGRSAEELAGAG